MPDGYEVEVKLVFDDSQVKETIDKINKAIQPSLTVASKEAGSKSESSSKKSLVTAEQILSKIPGLSRISSSVSGIGEKIASTGKVGKAISDVGAGMKTSLLAMGNKHLSGLTKGLGFSAKGSGGSGAGGDAGAGAEGAGGAEAGSGGIGASKLAGGLGAAMAVAELAKIVTFVAGIAANSVPMKAMLQLIEKTVTLFVLPAMIFFLGLMLPFIQFFFQILKSVNLPKVLTGMLTMGEQLGKVMMQMFQIIQPNLPLIFKALEVIMFIIAFSVVQPLLVIGAAVMAIVAIITIVSDFIKLLFKGISKLVALGELIGSGISGLLSLLSGTFLSVVTTIASILQTVVNAIDSINPSKMGSGIVSDIAGVVPHLATGGHVYSQGLAYLHSGETVVPSNSSSNSSTTFNIHLSSTGNTSMDLDTLAKEVKRRIEYQTRGSRAW